MINRCVTLNAVHIYNPDDCTHVNTITNPHLKFVRGIAQTQHQHIVVACSNNKGLLLLDQSFQYKCHIVTNKSFSDVSYSNEHLYALDFEHGKVIIFAYSNDAWIQIHEFKTQHSNSHQKDRLTVNNGDIYISSSVNNCLYVFTVDGCFRRQAGITGSANTPGQMSGALLCNVDNCGNVLVADYSNHRLQVYESSGDVWCFVILPGAVMHNPVDALSDEMADNTWIITHQPKLLVKISNQ